MITVGDEVVHGVDETPHEIVEVLVGALLFQQPCPFQVIGDLLPHLLLSLRAQILVSDLHKRVRFRINLAASIDLSRCCGKSRRMPWVVQVELPPPAGGEERPGQGKVAARMGEARKDKETRQKTALGRFFSLRGWA